MKKKKTPRQEVLPYRIRKTTPAFLPGYAFALSGPGLAGYHIFQDTQESRALDMALVGAKEIKAIYDAGRKSVR